MLPALEEFAANVRIADVFDVAVIAVLIYLGLKWLVRRGGSAAVTAVVLVALLYGAADLLAMYLTLLWFPSTFPI